MDQAKFVKKMSDEDIVPITQEELESAVNRSFDFFGKRSVPEGTYNIVIAMEEFSECIQQCSKFIRGAIDRDHLLEELADVYIAAEYIKKVGNFTDDEIKRAMRIKIIEFDKKMKNFDKPVKDKKKKDKKGKKSKNKKNKK